jgi:vacuolar-type H+-ATPase subunit D/Vma8
MENELVNTKLELANATNQCTRLVEELKSYKQVTPSAS